MRELVYSAPGFAKRLSRFCSNAATSGEVRATVEGILNDVRKRGDRAVIDCTLRYDGVRLSSARIRVPEKEIKRAAEKMGASWRRAVREAIHNVSAFHRNGAPENWQSENSHGAEVGEVYYPLERVGIYIPGGRVPLVSTVLMTVTLARIAGVPEIAVATPPRTDGTIDAGILAALGMCGAREVYRVGGAQAIAAFAYGTDTVPPVCKIFGPGSAYVNEAKRQVFGDVGIDILAGPSEVMVIADSAARADYIAADLLAQGEHGPGGKLILATTSGLLVESVKRELRNQANQLGADESLREVLKNGCMIVRVKTLDQAATVANLVAPEHLELHVGRRGQRALVRKVRNADGKLPLLQN